ncbi:hypothetical protein VT84_21600 [Gemmata sp. SH-PL17]|uniref:hypothetical protein n=1 Tax=Gemmata sp. SH-PL17 TaxID=1630693 RepID=UPI00078D292D|nr:hypothetical protein [Gemmata sp. SH-PL17]AMV27012.1 hypothetical protein VT84_21600 [Gemmata sp. SH-PL17]
MRTHGRGYGWNGWRGAAILFVATVSGCATQTDATSVKTRRPGEALRAASAPVPPTQEIEILDPNVDPTGKPTVRTAAFVPPGSNPACAVLPASAPQQQIDVPPTVLVHKFYYTGNRTFQGPMLTGGPVIVSANHPKTLERTYVPVMLPPGAPRVTYTNDTIRYDFGPQSVTLVFGHCGNPRVRYSQSTNASETAHKKIAATKAETRSFVQRTGIPEGMQRFKEGTKSTCGAIADRINDVGHTTADVFRNATDFIPGAQLLKSTPEDKAVREQERLQRATESRPTLDETFVPRAP